MKRSGRYRIRKGWFGKCVLQEWCEWQGGSCELPDTCNGWVDVDFHHAPTELTRNTEDRP